MWHKMQHGKCPEDANFILGPGYMALHALEPLIAHFAHQFLLGGDCFTLLYISFYLLVISSSLFLFLFQFYISDKSLEESISVALLPYSYASASRCFFGFIFKFMLLFKSEASKERWRKDTSEERLSVI